ncbi:uncharacterized protein YneF (UPF0154 family) [Dysgonomonas sp. PFB1-18]|nr:uncharacterized protein YneF (UPF0154 family) [Dysgonomonas sp. PF1-14]MDH6340915.1 uncharacterized protein YneF (UPF0154 family) [Dysgonomonas sp. PF1-16]MDH6382670.1 uncharacterized protein YneF (UPF0154 family) [Dysgonomonas sp. PFB1-18]MDH6399890.1 uncharacterized protein YneF (UPF0154 family) [Dysgonomonas sp. PF1-23]
MKSIKKYICIYILLSILIGMFSVYKYITKHIRLKYGVDELSLLGENPYEILESQVNDMIDYICLIGIYIIVGVVGGLLVLRSIRKSDI